MRRVALLLALGLPLSGLFLYLALRGVHMPRVFEAVSGASVPFVALAVLCLACVYLIQALRWRIVCRRTLPLRAHVEMVIGSMAVNNVLPGRLGDILRARWLATDARMAGGYALATVVIDRATDLAVLVALFFVTAPLVTGAGWIDRLVIAGGVLVGAIAVLFLLVRLYTRRRPRDRVPRRGRARGLLRDTADELSRSFGRRETLEVIVAGLVAWVAWALAAYLVARALDISIDAKEALFLTGAINLGVALPSSPGFVGAYQWFAVSALSLFDVEREPALAFSLVMQASWYLPTTLLGGAFVVRRTAGTVWARRELGGLDPIDGA